ncbi:Sulfide:quinone oxidoreductase, mitochondrial [Dirofilaria immitis]|nr:Sulfide:quinone oxidoreductase, mitochondrial [Dirofilaria immitis]
MTMKDVAIRLSTSIVQFELSSQRFLCNNDKCNLLNSSDFLTVEFITYLPMKKNRLDDRNDLPEEAISSYKIVIIGGGTGGCSLSHWCHKLVPKGQVAVIDSADEHHYQPGYTFVGGGLCKLQQCIKPMKEVLHPDNAWIKKAAQKINPKENSITLNDGTTISYELLIVAAGLEVRFDLVKNLPEALSDSYVCSIYRADLARKTQECLYAFNKGRAIFTLPNAPIKCSGAAQKICYLADEIFRKRGIREQVHITYNTFLPDVFDVPKYAKALNEIIRKKSIELKLLRNLKSINISEREATFELTGKDNRPTGELEIQKFDFLHVAPPCSAPLVLRNSPEITSANGFLDVNQKSLQHIKFTNIFGIGDCIGFYVVRCTVLPIHFQYNCYSSCPVIVSFRHVVLAEFTPEGPFETLPFNQAKPRYISFLLTRYVLPFIYWKLGVKGYWLGPSMIRKILHLGISK